MRTYTYDEIKRGHLGFLLGFAFCFLVAMLVTWVAGCGDPNVPKEDGPPVVDIQCSQGACTILVHYADLVTTWYDGEFYWTEDIVPPGRRYTTYGPAPEYSVTVEACNEYGCTERTLVLIELAQNDDDPIGCDPSLPCPIEVA